MGVNVTLTNSCHLFLEYFFQVFRKHHCGQLISWRNLHFMVGIIPPQDFAFFCDETGISQDRYMVVGGLSVHRNTISSVHKNMAEYRAKNNMNAELKWSKISDQKIEEYKNLVEYFFAMNNQNYMQFHCIVFDNHTWDHRRHNGDRDLGLSKIYYQLLLHKFCKTHAAAGSLFVCLDHRNSTTPLEHLKSMINSAAASKCGIYTNPVKQLLSRDSKTEELLQINDVILGAVGAVKNGKHLLATTRNSKREIAQLVLDKSGLSSFDKDSPRNVSRFTVWNFNSRTGRPLAPTLIKTA